MSTIQGIQRAVVALSPDELSEFRSWFLGFQADAWDRQLEQDAVEGRLDALAQDALGHLRAHRTRRL